MNGLNELSNIKKTAQGNRGSITLSVTGPNIPDITGATITGYKTDTSTGTSYDITGTLAVSDGPNRQFDWTFSEVDTGTAGIWRVYFKLVIGGVEYRTLPASWEVANSPDFVAVPGDPVVLVGVSPDEASWLEAAYDGFVAATTGQRLVKSAGGEPEWTTASEEASYYDVQLGFNGAPANADKDYVVLGRACRLTRTNPSSTVSGYAHAETAPDATAAFTLTKNADATVLEEIEWTVAGGTTGAFSGDIAATAVDFAAGDRLYLNGPATADTSLADIRVLVRLELI